MHFLNKRNLLLVYNLLYSYAYWSKYWGTGSIGSRTASAQGKGRSSKITAPVRRRHEHTWAVRCGILLKNGTSTRGIWRPRRKTSLELVDKRRRPHYTVAHTFSEGLRGRNFGWAPTCAVVKKGMISVKIATYIIVKCHSSRV